MVVWVWAQPCTQPEIHRAGGGCGESGWSRRWEPATPAWVRCSKEGDQVPQAWGPWGVPSSDERNALLLFLACGQHVLRFTAQLIETKWTCPASFSDPSPSPGPPHRWLWCWCWQGSAVMEGARAGLERGRGQWLLFCCYLLSLLLRSCSSGLHALASRVLPQHLFLRFLSTLIFCYIFFPEIFLYPHAWWQWLGRVPGGLTGRQELLPLCPSKERCYYSSTICRYFTI